MTSSQRTGAAVTIICHALALLILFVWGFPIPYPPPPEEGIQINFGNVENSGSGIAEPLHRENAYSPPPTAQPAPAQNEQILTQDYEDAPVINTKEKSRRRKAQETSPKSIPDRTQEQKPQRTINKDALFPGRSAEGGRQALSEGETAVARGNQGASDGSPAAHNRQGAGGGSSANLAGRTLTGTLPAPKYDVQEAGRIVVRIKVDRSGRVVEAKAQQAGSTLINATLYAAAERAAVQAKFSAADEDAPLYQSGTIVYVFKMGQQ